MSNSSAGAVVRVKIEPDENSQLLTKTVIEPGANTVVGRCNSDEPQAKRIKLTDHVRNSQHPVVFPRIKKELVDEPKVTQPSPNIASSAPSVDVVVKPGLGTSAIAAAVASSTSSSSNAGDAGSASSAATAPTVFTVPTGLDGTVLQHQLQNSTNLSNEMKTKLRLNCRGNSPRLRADGSHMAPGERQHGRLQRWSLEEHREVVERWNAVKDKMSAPAFAQLEAATHPAKYPPRSADSVYTHMKPGRSPAKRLLKEFEAANATSK